MSDAESGRPVDIQTKIQMAGHLTFGSPEWHALMPEVARLLDARIDADRDRMVGLTQIAQLAGVAPGTAIQWRQRTRRGELTGDRALPDPDDDETFPDKPMWKLSTALNFLLRAKKWPLGAAGRPLERGPREPHEEAAESTREAVDVQ
jgi:hypothetical protein